MKKRISAWLLIIVVALMTVALSSCSNTEEKLIGTWEESEAVLHGTITFEPDGIGCVKVEAIGVNARFSWKLDKKTIVMTIPGFEPTKFEILELTDDTLVVLANGEKDKLTRVKE